MSGLLDPKSRVMDVVLTDVGRQALARGDLQIKYYSFNDASVFYSRDLASGTVDLSRRVYLESASSLPQDVISLLSDASGQIVRVKSTAMTSSVFGGRLLSGTYASGTVLTGAAFTAQAGLLLSSSLENFQNNFVLGTVDDFFDDDSFGVGPGNVRFVVGTDAANVKTKDQTVSVSALENLLQDPLFSHLPNFRYLPPVNKPTDPEQTPSSLGAYSSFGGDVELSFADVDASVVQAAASGRVRVVSFDPAPRENNVHLQFFEQTASGLNKLSVVDFGTHRGSRNEPVRTLFVGKLYQDDFGAETFVRLFTVTLA